MARPAAAGRRGGVLPIQRPAAAADPAGGESQPEKSLNCFVRVLATMELVGNALGAAASLWASGVLIVLLPRELTMANPAAADDGDHSIQIDEAAADPAGGESQRTGSAAAKSEEDLNLFVRILATIELVGNALGAVASLWASGVLIGSYRNSLKQTDFWIVTGITFVEGFRMIIRNFTSDHQSLFGSTKALTGRFSSFARMLCRPREGSEVLLIISWILNIFYPFKLWPVIGEYCQVVGLAVMTRMPFIIEAPRRMREEREKRPWSLLVLWVLIITLPLIAAVVTVAIEGGPSLVDLTPLSQLVAVLLLTLLGPWSPTTSTTPTSSPRWPMEVDKLCSVQTMLQAALDSHKVYVVALLCFGFPGQVRHWHIEPLLWTGGPIEVVALLVCSLWDPPGAKYALSRLINRIMNICFLWDLVLPSPREIRRGISAIDAILIPVQLLVLLIGNLQIPVAVVEIWLSSWRLASLHGDSPTNMKASMQVFYGLAVCQGSLYIVACILALFSFFPRRWLVRRLKLGGEGGVKAVDLYYEHAYTTRMEAGVFAEDTVSLASFAVDSLNSTTSSSTSSSRDKQLAGVRVLHSLLQPSSDGARDDSSQETISLITRTEKAVPTLIRMLGWCTFEEDRDIRLFAARVTKVLSCDLRIAGIPGGVKLVSSLLDAVTDERGRDGHDRPQNEQGWWCSCLCQCWTWMKNKWSILDECWTWMKNKWSILDEEPLTSSLPTLGLEILECLARDTDNCAEIIKATNLVPKIIGLTTYTDNTDERQISLSLNLLKTLATTKGKIGASLRQELWESWDDILILVCNLAGILENSHSNEVLKLAMYIIAIMAWDEDARQELGSVQVIIHKLVLVFVGQDGPTRDDQSVRRAAGEALTNLALESPANCLAILEEEERQPGYELVKDLKDMLGSDQYRCFAASLLQNLCACSSIRNRLLDPEASNHLSEAFPVLLQNIIRTAEGKELEALIGLASQICYVLPPQCFVQGLQPESRTIRKTCVRKLVDTLNSNERPNHEYPRMRRAIVEMVISVLERCPRYAIIFRRRGMMNALSKIGMNPSKVDKYRIFLGNEGVVLEKGMPLHDLVARARGLIDPTTLTPGAQPNGHA